MKTKVNKFAIFSYTAFKLDKQTLRSYLKLTYECELHVLSNTKVSDAKDHGKNLWRSDIPESAILSVIVYSMTCSPLQREILWRHISKNRKATGVKFCIRHSFMAIMTHAKFHFNRLMLTFIFGIRASAPPPPGPGERLKRPGLRGLSNNCSKTCGYVD